METRNSSATLYTALLLTWLAHFMVDMMIGIWPIYKSLANLDLTKAGLIVAVGALIGEGGQLIFGPLSDRGYHKIIIIFGVLAATASSFMAYSIEYTGLFCLYLCTCLGSGAFHPAAAGLIGSLIPERRGLLMSLFASGGSLGLAFSHLIFTYIYFSLEGQTFFLAIPAVVLVLIMLLFALPKTKNIDKAHRMKIKDFVDFFKIRDLRLLYFALIANQSLFWGAIFILPDVLRTLGHVDWICHGGGHLCLILGGAVMMIPSGYLADKYSVRNVMLYAGIISCITFYVLLFSGGLSETFVLTCLFALGASLAIVHPLGLALGTRLVPNKPGTVSAFLMGLVWCVSEAIGPGGVGWLTGFFSDYAPVKALAVLGFFFLVNIYTVFLLPGKVSVTVAEGAT